MYYCKQKNWIDRRILTNLRLGEASALFCFLCETAPFWKNKLHEFVSFTYLPQDPIAIV